MTPERISHSAVPERSPLEGEKAGGAGVPDKQARDELVAHRRLNHIHVERTSRSAQVVTDRNEIERYIVGREPAVNVTRRSLLTKPLLAQAIVKPTQVAICGGGNHTVNIPGRPDTGKWRRLLQQWGDRAADEDHILDQWPQRTCH